MRRCYERAYTSSLSFLVSKMREGMRVRRKATLLVMALALAGLIASSGCQSEEAQEGGRTSGSPGITIQVGNGVLDGSPSSEITTGQQSALSGRERFSEENLRKAEEFVAQQMEQYNLPSVVVGVWVPGEGEYLSAKGEANFQTGSERGLGQPFRIASVTKTFTATAVLQLVDEGKLRTSDKLSKW
jgi:CubicO group peptidase (beta-lactamase class C family)